jgi:2-haloacid dehalogenase/putative hydrolase of the HAD superfamily
MLDFYGTVVHDDVAVVGAICERVASTLARPVPVVGIARQWSAWFADECGSAMGSAFKTQRHAARTSLVRLLEALGSPEDPDQVLEIQFAYWRRPELFEDTLYLLERIGRPVCVVSNTDRSDLEAAIGHHALVFDHIVTSEDARCYKPRPQIFERALELLGASREDVLHVGDSLSGDVAGASRAGIPVAWVNRAARQRPAGLELWAEVADLHELAELLEVA